MDSFMVYVLMIFFLDCFVLVLLIIKYILVLKYDLFNVFGVKVFVVMFFNIMVWEFRL